MIHAGSPLPERALGIHTGSKPLHPRKGIDRLDEVQAERTRLATSAVAEELFASVHVILVVPMQFAFAEVPGLDTNFELHDDVDVTAVVRFGTRMQTHQA